MKPYLVDVPVRMNIWIRPECQRKQWDVIRKVRPSILFIQSDGGRNETEWKAINANRKMIDGELDWECKVYRFYENKNNGLYAMGKKVHDFIWNTVDRCIFLEDDHLPSESFFEYCKVLLDKYETDMRIECICGVNALEKSTNVSSDYFFARQGSIWGTATWKSRIEERNCFDYYKDPYIMSLLKERTKHNKTAWKRLNAYATNSIYEGHAPGTEFLYEFSMYSQNRLQIIPRVNLISNIGSTENSEHAMELNLMPKKLRRLFNMPVYEMSFPLKHANYVILDVEYEKKRNRLLNHNHPFLKLLCDIERIGLTVKYKGVKYTYRLVKQKLIRNKEK